MSQTPNEDRSGNLLARWRGGDQQAAAELFHRYATRLVALARSHLSRRLARRVDPEDVVQSVYRCFFADAQEVRFDCEQQGDLWRLLVTITLHKLRDQAKHNSCAKRSINGEQYFGSEDTLFGLRAAALANGPSPLEAVALADQLEHLLRPLEPRQRDMVQLRLQGYSLEEIAVRADCSQRTVIRTLERVKKNLEQWQSADSSQ